MATTAIYLNLLQWEWFRLRQRVGFWVIVGIFALFVVGILAVIAMIANLSPDTLAIPPQGFPAAVSQGLSSLGQFFGIVLASFLLGSDFSWGTWRPLIARGDPRHWPIYSKLLLGCAILMVVWVVAWCVAAAMGLLLGDDEGGVISEFLFDVPDGWGRTALLFFAGLPVAITYMALGALLCVAARSSTVGVGVGIAIVVAESAAYPLANVIVRGLYDFELQPYTRWTLWGVSNGLTGSDELAAAWFLPAILAYLAGLCALTLLIFERRDVDSGNG